MNTIKQIVKLRRKNCTIRIAVDTTLEKGFWGEVRDLAGNTIHQTNYQYTQDEALELAKENAPVLVRSVRMSEQQRRDEKHGLYGGLEDVAN